MISDLGTSSVDHVRPAAASPLRREARRDDGRPAFDLFLNDQRALLAGPSKVTQAGEPGPTDESTSDRDSHRSIARHIERAQRDHEEENVAKKESSSTGSDDTEGRDRAVAGATSGEVDPLTPEEHPSAAGDDAVADGTPGIFSPQPADVIANPRIAIEAAPTPPEGSAPSACGPVECLPISAIPLPADETAMNLTLAPLSAIINTALATAASTDAGNAAAVALSAATAHGIAATGGSGSGGPALGSGGSATTPLENIAAGGDGSNPAAVPVTAALKNETPADGQASQQQGQDHADFRHLAVAPGASAEASSSAAVTADKPAAPARPLPEQIAVHMARGAKNGLSHLHIALEPDSLGRLEIHLDFHRDGRLSAAIVADRPETLNLLRSEAHSLQDQLNAAGFKASSDSLSFDLGSSNDRPPVHAEVPTRRSSLRFGESDETGEDVSAATSVFWRPMPSGRLDIRA